MSKHTKSQAQQTLRQQLTQLEQPSVFVWLGTSKAPLQVPQLEDRQAHHSQTLDTITNATRGDWSSGSARQSWRRSARNVTFYDCEGRLIGGSKTPGVPDTLDATIPEDDWLVDLNPETVSQDHGPNKEPDIDQPLVKTVEQAQDPIETLEDAVCLHDSNEQIQPDLQQTATWTNQRQSAWSRSNSFALFITCLCLTSTACTIIWQKVLWKHCCHQRSPLSPWWSHGPWTRPPGPCHHDPALHESWHETQFKECGKEAVSKELSQLHFRDTFEPVNPKELADQDMMAKPPGVPNPKTMRFPHDDTSCAWRTTGIKGVMVESL
jgi:hypothetical protein